MSPARLKGDWASWRDKPYAVNADTEEKRKQGERWAALNEYVRRNGGAVVSVPGNKTLRIECLPGSALPQRLRELGYITVERGRTTGITGAPSVKRQDRAPHPHRSERLPRNGRSRN
jgi:hypothetical protein